MLKRQQQGFTIMELLIAVTVFSLVLILITTGVLRFSRQYYQGVIAGKTQDAARAVVDDITRGIQFNGGEVVTVPEDPSQPASSDNPVVGYCIGEAKRYRLYPNTQIIDASPNTALHQGRHALVSDDIPCNITTPMPSVKDKIALPGKNPRELLGSRMRLAALDISGNGDLWTVTVRIVYGDDQFLCDSSADPNSPAGCSNQDPPLALPDGVDLNKLSCRAINGSQFCAVSELTTTIDKRVKRVN